MGLRRLIAPFAVLGAALLVSCSPGADTESAQQAWLDAQEMTPLPDTAIGSLASTISAGIDAAGSGESASMGFTEPARLERVEFVCFGEGTMNGTVTTESASGSSSSTSEVLRCSDGQQVLEVSPSSNGDVITVRFGASDSSEDSAWRVVIFGQQ